MTSHDDIPDVQFPPNLDPVRLLGHGSMASVYLARDRTLKRLVAIKFLKPELCRDNQSRQRFEREAQAAARLAHDGITTVFSVGRVDDGRPYIEMEYVDGGNLEDLLHSRRHFEISEARKLLAQIASALAAAHQQNIVHRDVKPANILVNTAGDASLTDFGVAAILQTGGEALTRLTRENERLGDPRYMSPEQLRGEPPTGQSDIYSLGVIAYELLSGKGPFDDAEVGDMASAHLRRPPPNVADRRADIPQALARVLKQCLAKRPEHRPRANDLVGFLKDATGVATVTEETPSKGPVAEFLNELKQRRVYQAAVAYAAVAFVLLQVVDLLLQPWPSLDVVYRLTVMGSLIGFPIAIVLAWIFDLRHGKLVRTAPTGGQVDPPAASVQRRILMGIGLTLAVALALAIAWWLFVR